MASSYLREQQAALYASIKTGARALATLRNGYDDPRKMDRAFRRLTDAQQYKVSRYRDSIDRIDRDIRSLRRQHSDRALYTHLVGVPPTQPISVETRPYGILFDVGRRDMGITNERREANGYGLAFLSADRVPVGLVPNKSKPTRLHEAAHLFDYAIGLLQPGGQTKVAGKKVYFASSDVENSLWIEAIAQLSSGSKPDFSHISSSETYPQWIDRTRRGIRTAKAIRAAEPNSRPVRDAWLKTFGYIDEAEQETAKTLLGEPNLEKYESDVERLDSLVARNELMVNRLLPMTGDSLKKYADFLRIASLQRFYRFLPGLVAQGGPSEPLSPFLWSFLLDVDDDTSRALARAGLSDHARLLFLEEAEVRDLPGIGKQRFEDITQAMEKKGLRFGMGYRSALRKIGLHRASP